MKKIITWMKSEIVLVLSFVLASISVLIIKPSKEYLNYIDFRTLAILFCLMLVVSGFNESGIFKRIAITFVKKVHSLRGLGFTLCLLCFFSAMVITNDVTLITFVPFTILIIKMIGKEEKLVYLVACETIAANLGSMMTPIGSPQNLYLFSFYQMTFLSFVQIVFPYVFFSFVLLLVATFGIRNDGIETFSQEEKESKKNPLLILYGVLFCFAIMSVFRFISYGIVLLVTVTLVVCFDRKNLKKVDYSLLLTFCFLFIFIGNLGKIPLFSTFLKRVIDGNEMLVSILTSQIFSNVPTAILLSNYTDQVKALIIGVNLGGLGTLIASMASLISYKFMVREKIKSSKYLLVFTALNLLFLISHLLFSFIIKLF